MLGLSLEITRYFSPLNMIIPFIDIPFQFTGTESGVFGERLNCALENYVRRKIILCVWGAEKYHLPGLQELCMKRPQSRLSAKETSRQKAAATDGAHKAFSPHQTPHFVITHGFLLLFVTFIYLFLFVCFAWCAPLHSHWLELILTQGLSQTGDAAAVTTTLTLNLNKKAFLRWLNEVWVSLAVFIVKLLKTSFLWNDVHSAPCVFTMHQFIGTITSKKMPTIWWCVPNFVTFCSLQTTTSFLSRIFSLFWPQLPCTERTPFKLIHRRSKHR